jgi:hypothetical protein
MWLASIGISTSEELEAFGVVDAYYGLKQAYPDRVTINLLYALQGALLGLPWNLLPEDMKADLKQQAEALERRNVET